MSAEELAEMLMKALMDNNANMMRQGAREAVERYAGMEPGRPVGGTYYLYRTLRNLDLEGLEERLMSDGKNLVGVDIGSSSIKVCQVKEGRKGVSLVKLGYAPLPAQTIVDGHVMNSSVVVEALEKLFQDEKIKAREVKLFTGELTATGAGILLGALRDEIYKIT